MKLTETIVRNLPTPAKPTLSSDDMTTNLYLKISTAGTKTFVYRARRGKQWEVVTLGRFPAMSLALARKKASDLNDRKDGGANLTFGELLDRWYATQIEPNYKVTKNIETYVARGKGALGSKQLSVMTTREMVAELQRYAAVSPVSANRCLSSWKLCLDYGVQIGAIEHNPLARTTSKAAGGKEVSRNRTLTDDEIRAMWAWQGRNASLLRFLLLTGLRISEAQQGRQDGSLWRCDMTKNGKPHWVHLPDLTMQQVEPWETSPTAVQSWLRRKGADFTPHDLRRTFATRANAIGIQPHIVERCLNHTMPGVMSVYNRFDYAAERIDAAVKLSEEIARIVDFDNKL